VRPSHAARLGTAASLCINSGGTRQRWLAYNEALALRPDDTDVLVNRGVTLHDLKRFDEALASYDHAIALRPDDADAHFFKGLSSLVIGDFEPGWIEYDWRREAPAARITRPRFSAAALARSG